MPVTFSSTDICNRALQMLGANPIVSLTDGSKNARECALCYDKLRQSLLRSHAWNFATVFASLPELASPPNPTPANSLWANTHVYALPADFLRLVQVSPFVGTWLWEGTQYVQAQDYFIQNQTLLSWVQAPYNMRYIYDCVNTGAMDPIFQEALSAYMAMEMCERLTQSTSKFQAASAKMIQIMAEARRINAFDKPAGASPVDSWISVRV